MHRYCCCSLSHYKFNVFGVVFGERSFLRLCPAHRTQAYRIRIICFALHIIIICIKCECVSRVKHEQSNNQICWRISHFSFAGLSKKKMWRAPCWRCALCIVDLISRRRRRHAAPQTEINKRNNEIYFFCTLSGHVPNTHKRTRTRVLHTPKKVSSYEPHTSYDLATLTRLFSDSKYASIRVCNGMFVVRVCAVTVHRAVVLCCVLRTKIKKDRPQEDVEHRYFSSFHFIFHSHLLLLFYFSIILRHVGFTGCGVSVFLVRIRFWIELVQSGWWHHSCCCTVAVCTKALLCIWKCCNWKEHVLRFQLSLTMWERKADHVFIPRKRIFQTKWFLWISSPVRNS